MKWLREDPMGGFRAKLRYVGPGWSPSPAMRATHHTRSRRFAYVIVGSMDLVVDGEPRTVAEDWFIEQPPEAVWEWDTDPASEHGCMWLEVTYASGTSLSLGRVEEPVPLRA